MTQDNRIPTVDPDAQKRRRMGIKNLTPGLVERGKIKIGMKGAERQKRGGGGTFQMPQKLDHFLITTMERGQDNNFKRDEQLHQQLGPKPTEIPVVLIYDDIDLNFQTRYAAYNGRTLWCTGDGETARRMSSPAQDGQAAQYKEGPCPCHRQDPAYQGKDKCKINGTLSVMIRGAEAVGGVWKMRTTSYNSVVGILSSLALIKRITGGPLAGIPLMMTLTPKAVADPVTGSQQTVYVVGLEYRGGMEALQDQGHNLLLSRTTHNLRIEHIEDEARQLIDMRPANYAAPDSVDDEVEEFYPEAVSGELVTDRDDGFHRHTAPQAANDNKPTGGADALNAAAMAGAGNSYAKTAESYKGTEYESQKPASAQADPVADGKSGSDNTDSPRVAGRLTYWVNRDTGEFRVIEKGEAIPDDGDTVAKATYEEFTASADAKQDEPPADYGRDDEPADDDQQDSGGGVNLF